MSKISYVKRINCVMITLSKFLSIKIKKHFFSIFNEVKVFYKRKLERKKIQNATFLNSVPLISAFSDVFKGYSNATLG